MIGNIAPEIGRDLAPKAIELEEVFEEPVERASGRFHWGIFWTAIQ